MMEGDIGDGDRAEFSDMDSSSEIEYSSEDESDQLNPTFESNIAMFTFIHGEKTIELTRKCFDEMHVVLKFKIPGLTSTMASAWDLQQGKDVYIKFEGLDYSYFLNATTPPKVRCYYSESEENRSIILMQIENIGQWFVNELWRKETFGNKYMDSVTAKHREEESSLSTLSEINPEIERTICRQLLKMHGDIHHATEALTEILENYKEESTYCQRLVEMGFKTDSCIVALHIAQQDFADALDLLTSKPQESFADHSTSLLESKCNFKTGLAAIPTLTPNFGNGFFVAVLDYLLMRIKTLTQFCVICDQPLLHQNVAMIKSMVCSRELCVFQYYTFAHIHHLHEKCAVQEKIADLLLGFTYYASLSERWHKVLNPFPIVVDHQDQSIIIGDRDKAKGRKMILEICAAYPNHPHAQLLKLSVISSNLCHIVHLTGENKVNFLGEDVDQFLLLSATSDKEAAFKKMKAEHGSVYSFHGSPYENWHSIIRRGLLNCSDTDMQLHGTAYGKGIYSSTSLFRALDYAIPRNRDYPRDYGRFSTRRRMPEEPQPEDPQFMSKTGHQCVALCEVIPTGLATPDHHVYHQQLNSGTHVAGCPYILVQPDASKVMTRFLFVFKDPQGSITSHPHYVLTNDEKIKTEIDRAVNGFC